MLLNSHIYMREMASVSLTHYNFYVAFIACHLPKLVHAINQTAANRFDVQIFLRAFLAYHSTINCVTFSYTLFQSNLCNAITNTWETPLFLSTFLFTKTPVQIKLKLLIISVEFSRVQTTPFNSCCNMQILTKYLHIYF